MSVTTAARPSTANPRTHRAAALPRAAAVATALAAVTVELYAAIIRGAGVHLAIGNAGAHTKAEIGFGACAVAIVMCMVAGTLVAAGVNRWATRPARTFTMTALVLTAMSVIPTSIAYADVSTKLALIGAHLIAAAIAIPLITRSLRTPR